MSERLCRVCAGIVNAATPLGFDLCKDCIAKLGVIPMPPARRPSRPCDRCNTTRFLRVVPRELSATGSDYVYESAAPMMLTYVPELNPGGWLSGPSAKPVQPEQGRGKLEAYVCRGCGFVEWYCLDPESVPIGPEYMTEDLDVGPKTPYR